MAHFAKINEAGIVSRVTVINNSVLLDSNGVESEQKGIDFLQNMHGGTWIQTSYNKNFRKRFAGLGDTYDSDLDAFITPQPHPSWTLNTTTCDWEAPVALPDDADTVFYMWDDDALSWVEPEN